MDMKVNVIKYLGSMVYLTNSNKNQTKTAMMRNMENQLLVNRQTPWQFVGWVKNQGL